MARPSMKIERDELAAAIVEWLDEGGMTALYDVASHGFKGVNDMSTEEFWKAWDFYILGADQ